MYALCVYFSRLLSLRHYCYVRHSVRPRWLLAGDGNWCFLIADRCLASVNWTDITDRLSDTSVQHGFCFEVFFSGLFVAFQRYLL